MALCDKFYIQKQTVFSPCELRP